MKRKRRRICKKLLSVNIHIPSWGGGLKPAEESLIGTKSYKKFVNSKIEPTIKNTLSK